MVNVNEEFLSCLVDFEMKTRWSENMPSLPYALARGLSLNLIRCRLLSPTHVYLHVEDRARSPELSDLFIVAVDTGLP